MISVFREDGLPLVREVEWRSDAWQRARGLIGVVSLDADHGLILAPCHAIHTCFMRFDLDIVFFSRAGLVIRTAAGVKPFHTVWGGWQAWGVLEMQSGWFPWGNLRKGIRLVFMKNAFLPDSCR